MRGPRPFNPGRVPHWDDRNEGFRIRAAVPRAAQSVDDIVREMRAKGVSARYHNATAWWGDQGDSPMCTAYSSLHYRHDGPVKPTGGPVPAVDPAAHYRAIQARDRAAGRVYAEGCTALAMAQEMVARGWCGEYRWGTTLAELVAALAAEPVLLGVNWHTGMYTPDTAGRIRVTGDVEGGHEIVADGVSFAARTIRLKNSWGRGWGRSGFCTLTFDDAARLIAEDGDVLLTRELKG